MTAETPARTERQNAASETSLAHETVGVRSPRKVGATSSKPTRAEIDYGSGVACGGVKVSSAPKDALDQIKETAEKKGDRQLPINNTEIVTIIADEWDKMFSEIRELLAKEKIESQRFGHSEALRVNELNIAHRQAKHFQCYGCGETKIRRAILCDDCFRRMEKEGGLKLDDVSVVALKDKRIAELEGGEDSKLASLEAAHELGIRHAKKQAERIAALEKECASWKFKYGNLANKFAELKAENGTFEKWLLDNQTEEDHYSKERPRPVITKLLKANEVLNMFRKKRLERNEN